MDTINDYAVGRGKVYFDRFLPGTMTSTGERYFGNTPTFSDGVTVTNLDHFSSDQGIKEKDKSIVLQIENTISMSTDNMQFDNLAVWFSGDNLAEDVAAETGLTQEVSATLGNFYQLGTTDDRPEGCGYVLNVVATTTVGVAATGSYTFTGQPTADTDTVTIAGHAITFKTSGATGAQVNIGGSKEATAAALRTYINTNTVTLGVTANADSGAVVNLVANAPGTAGNSITTVKSSTAITVSGTTLSGGAASTTIDTDNFDINLTTGRVQILPGAADISNGDLVTFTYDTTAISGRVRVVAQGEAIYGALRYIADNATGDNKDQYIPYCKISPDGALPLKGDTWTEMTFTVEALKKSPTTPRIIITEGQNA